ncbi:capsule assembly Wzi family protein [Spirosoma sp. SC4-14]|uniref:capsule assembly Wzi family protein n=1 Tax=Spirosoma sp. SC4-14 TaxID=3128900 RepID=UPI0030D4911C
MKHYFLFFILYVLPCYTTCAQSKSQYQVYVEAGGLVASSERTPFWLRANQFGTVPYSAPNGSLRTGIAGSILLTDTAGAYARKAPSRAWILSYGAEAIANATQESQLLAPEYYVKLAHRQIQFVVGRRREVIGLVDTLLTSGSYSWSGNALPIPKIQFGTKGFAPLGRRQWLAINAFIAHGWFANTNYMQHSYLHQKSVIFRVGKPSSTVRAYIGLNHNAQWAGHSNYLDYHYAVDGQLPNQLRDFPNVLFAIRIGGVNNPRVTSFDYVNLYGNHVGSTDFGLELRLAAVHLMLYHQHSFDDASGVMMQNIPDGLTGLRIQPRQHGSSAFRVDDLLIEFLSTLNQSGPSFYQDNTHTKGADNYFNNGQYQEGWVYKGHIIGTPFITRRQDVKPELQNNTKWAINNNRVQMAHIGIRATVANRLQLLAKMSYSRNLGVPGEPLPGTPTQWASLVQVGMPLSWLGGMSLTASVAADVGQLYVNSIGGYVGLRKTVWQRGN